jgi:WD40 repeat protein
MHTFPYTTLFRSYFAVTPSSSLDYYLRVYNASTGELAMKFTDSVGPYGDMRCVAFSPDSTRIIAGGADRVLRQYSLTTGKQLTRTLSTGGAWINGCDFSELSTIAFNEGLSAYQARIIDSSTGKDTNKISDGSTPYALKFKPASK